VRQQGAHAPATLQNDDTGATVAIEDFAFRLIALRYGEMRIFYRPIATVLLIQKLPVSTVHCEFMNRNADPHSAKKPLRGTPRRHAR
jgi:hypothetical protein